MALRKDFFVKVYDKHNGAYKFTLSSREFIDKPSFSISLNDGATPMELSVVDGFYDFLNGKSNVSNLKVGDLVTFYVQDKDGVEPVPMYSGLYAGYGFGRSNKKENLTVLFLPNTFLLTKKFLTADDDGLEVSYLSENLATIIKSLIDNRFSGRGVHFPGTGFAAIGYNPSAIDISPTSTTFSLCATFMNFGNDSNAEIFSFGAGLTAGKTLGLFYNRLTRVFTYRLYDSGVADRVSYTVNDILLDENVKHTAIVSVNGATANLYIDGVLVDTQTATGNFEFKATGDSSLAGIGIAGSRSGILSGGFIIDVFDARAYGRTIGYNEARVYHNYGTISKSDLSLWYKLNEEEGSKVIIDYGSSGIDLDYAVYGIVAPIPVNNGISQIDSYVGGLKYSDDSIDDPFVLRSYDFKNISIFEAISKAASLSPANWFFYIGADNLIYFKKFEGQTIHKLKYDTLESFNFGRDLTAIINKVLFVGGGDPALFNVYENVYSEISYGLAEELYVDERVTLDDTANRLSKHKIDNFSKPRVTGSVTIIDNNFTEKNGYDIDSIRVGDSVRISTDLIDDDYTRWGEFTWGVDYWKFIDTAVFGIDFRVSRMIYDFDKVTLELDFDPDMTTKRIEDINRDLTGFKSENSPSVPI